MTTWEKFRLLDPASLTWPCSFRYHLRTDWGDTQQVLSVDAPGVANLQGASTKLGLELWRRSVAIATTRQVSLLWWETVTWRTSSIPVPQVASSVFGLLSGNPSRREDTPHLELLTGHDDPLGFRRFPLAGSPSDWHDGHQLTFGGMNAVELTGRIMFCGMSNVLAAAPMRWLLAYPDLLPASAENPSGVGFRAVTDVRCFRHILRTPEPSSEPWP